MLTGGLCTYTTSDSTYWFSDVAHPNNNHLKVNVDLVLLADGGYLATFSIPYCHTNISVAINTGHLTSWVHDFKLPADLAFEPVVIALPETRTNLQYQFNRVSLTASGGLTFLWQPAGAPAEQVGCDPISFTARVIRVSV